MDAVVFPVTVGIVVGIAVLFMFSIFFTQLKPLAAPAWKTFTIHVGDVTLVTIVEGASLATSDKTFEPKIIKVIIGVNNTVRWVNQDVTFNTIIADNMSDQEFWKATNPDESSNVDQLLSPGETFEYTFTKPGQFGYHGEPHPHMRGTVIVLSGSEK